MKILIIAIILLSIGCNSEKKKTYSILEKMINKKIVFYNNNQYKIEGKDTIIDYVDKKTYKLIVFSDSSSCELCDLHLGEWYLKNKEAKYYNSNFILIIIVQSKDYHSFEHYAHEIYPNFPFIYDPSGIFIKNNELPLEKKYHTFLLNENNEIILVGSPIGNDNVWNLYKKILKEGSMLYDV